MLGLGLGLALGLALNAKRLVVLDELAALVDPIALGQTNSTRMALCRGLSPSGETVCRAKRGWTNCAAARAMSSRR